MKLEKAMRLSSEYQSWLDNDIPEGGMPSDADFVKWVDKRKVVRDATMRHCLIHFGELVEALGYCEEHSESVAVRDVAKMVIKIVGEVKT